MIIRRPRSSLGALVGLGLGGLVAACTYSWTVATAPPPPDDAGSRDAAVDAPSSPDSGSDAALDSGLPSDTGSDASNGDAAPSCASLEAQVASARGPAKSCTEGAAGECVAHLTDECGCTSYLTGSITSASSVTYASAIGAFVEAGCPHPSSCFTCPIPGTGTCLYGDAGPECYP
jgi:hypothetical protein